jgi:hypothetical protein
MCVHIYSRIFIYIHKMGRGLSPDPPQPRTVTVGYFLWGGGGAVSGVRVAPI